MGGTVLITGGAGFIGSHVADELLVHGYRVRILDALSPQIHAGLESWPEYLASTVEPIEGDVRDPKAVGRALDGVDSVLHLAAMVGVGQSMYQVTDYVAVNDLGTAVLLQALIEQPVARLVVASSRSIYGEGLYRECDGRIVEDAARGVHQLRRGSWEALDREGRPLEPLPTPETKRPALASVYALNKYVQERMCLLVGEAYRIPTVALRFFNVFGPRQALSNPYTGVLAIFAARLLNGNPPLIFEDGRQRRDFVDVRDVARACRLALEAEHAPGHAINVGSGRSYTVREIARRLTQLLGRPEIEPEITGRFRAGDISHCFADLALARDLLGYRCEIDLDSGLVTLADWLSSQIAVDNVDQATRELAVRGLVA